MKDDRHDTGAPHRLCLGDDVARDARLVLALLIDASQLDALRSKTVHTLGA
jgi:hypothetical protein